MIYFGRWRSNNGSSISYELSDSDYMSFFKDIKVAYDASISPFYDRATCSEWLELRHPEFVRTGWDSSCMTYISSYSEGNSNYGVFMQTVSSI